MYIRDILETDYNQLVDMWTLQLQDKMSCVYHSAPMTIERLKKKLATMKVKICISDDKIAGFIGYTDKNIAFIMLDENDEQDKIKVSDNLVREFYKQSSQETVNHLVSVDSFMEKMIARYPHVSTEKVTIKSNRQDKDFIRMTTNRAAVMAFLGE